MKMYLIKKVVNIKVVGLYLIVLICHSLYAAPAEDIMRAMRDEIKRSMKELKLEKLQPPYYLEYKLTVQDAYNISAALGSLTKSSNSRTARLTVGLRIGDYKFDNTNFFDIGLGFFGSGDDEEVYKNRNVPEELDYTTLRRELWLATDAAYKQQSEIFSKKEALLKNRLRQDTTHDFLYLPPVQKYDTASIPTFNTVKYENLCQEISAIFQKFNMLDVSSVNIEYLPATTYYVNSEGREYIKTELFTGFEVAAATQGKDGMPLTDFFSAYATVPENLPAKDSISKAVTNLANKLSNETNYNILEESYSGPVLFEGQAAAEIFAQVFAPNLVAQRQALTETGLGESGRYGNFQTKIGGRVLPEFLSVYAKPNMKSVESLKSKEKNKMTELLGYFKIDDQGVQPKDVTIVHNGFLRALLSSRTPTKRIRYSNGHTRGGAPMLSNIELISDSLHRKNYNELKDKLIQLCKDRELPYGIIVRKVINQNIQFTTITRLTQGMLSIRFGQNIIPLLEVYKIYVDGREEPIRGCELNGLTVSSFKDILLTGNNQYALNYLAPAVISPYMTGGSQYIGTSIIIGDLLFEDCEIKPVEGDFPKPPILANPLK